MELLVFTAALFVLAALALRFGHDSRPTADSKEEAHANLGMRQEPTD